MISDERKDTKKLGAREWGVGNGEWGRRAAAPTAALRPFDFAQDKLGMTARGAGGTLVLLGFAAGFFGGGEQGHGEFFIEGEEVFDALAVVFERLRAVTAVHGAVEGGVGFDQRGRHGQRIVEVGQRRVRKFLARV